MARTAKYLVAQHVTDLFRNEPRNVGVFVAIGEEKTARFVGETGSERLDGHKIRFLPFPEVYRQWVDEWRRTLKSSNDPWRELPDTNGQHYRVIEGGEVADIGEDSVHDVAAFLFTSLVSDEGMGLALGGEEVEVVTARLAQDVGRAFVDAQILATDAPMLGQVRYPIRSDVSVQGQVGEHMPAFAQENGELIVMEIIDLTWTKRTAVKDHAGWAAFMFGDIKAKHPNKATTISIIRSTIEDEKQKAVAYALAMLESQSQIVNWLSDQDRTQFIEARVKTANG